jgi:hypothetical protein
MQWPLGMPLGGGAGLPKQTQAASNQVKDGVVWVYSYYTWKGQVHNTYYDQLTCNSLILQSHGLVRTF